MSFLNEKIVPLIINLGIILILLSPIPYGAVEVWSLSLFEISSIVIFCAWVIEQALNGRIELKGYQIYVPFGLFFLLIVLQVIPLPHFLLDVLSPKAANLWRSKQGALEHLFGDGIQMSYTISFAPYVTKQKLLLYVSYGMFYIVIANYVSSRKQIKRFFWVAFSVAIIECLVGLLQFITGLSNSSFGRASGTYVNPNNFAGLLGMIIPISMGYAFSLGYEESRLVKNLKGIANAQNINKLLLLFATALIALSLICSQSRGGILSFAVSVIFFYTLITWRGIGRGKFWAAGLFVIILISYAVWIGLDPVLERYSETREGFSSRLPVWKDTIRLIKDFPVFGTGLGTFGLSYTIYKDQAIWPLSFSHTHNDYLELAAETGLVGLILVLCGIALLFNKALNKIKNLPSSGDGFRLFLSIGCLSGILFMLIHALTEFNFQIPGNVFYFSFILGLLTSMIYHKPRTNST
jgi:O-antigen ligase